MPIGFKVSARFDCSPKKYFYFLLKIDTLSGVKSHCNFCYLRIFVPEFENCYKKSHWGLCNNKMVKLF